MCSYSIKWLIENKENEKRGKEAQFMKVQPQQLGRILAVLKSLSENTDTAPESEQLSEDDRELIQYLQQRISEIRHIQTTPEYRFTVPEYRCQTEECFLETEPDVFIHLLFGNGEKSTNEPTFCDSLIRHLNNCFHCFETFCVVMREFLHVRQ